MRHAPILHTVSTLCLKSVTKNAIRNPEHENPSHAASVSYRGIQICARILIPTQTMLSLQNMEPLRELTGIPYPTHIPATYLLITPAQYRKFSIAHYVSPLSIIGSIAIIYRICRFDRHDRDANNRRTYQRLLVAMSICDLFGSLALLFGTTPIPKMTHLEMARGNFTTCTIQGFFIHVFVVGVLYYNAGLMIYFVMTIRYRWSETYVAKSLEPCIHFVALCFPFGQAVAGLFLDIFNPIGFGAFCYISPYPVLCGLFDNACTRGQWARLLYTLFCTTPQFVLLAIIYISIMLIYCAVRDQARRALAIAANRNSVRARTKAVVVQSCLFATVFFFTWASSVLVPLLGYTVKESPAKVRSIYVLSILVSTFTPLQGFFNFLIYIRPRFLRMWRDRKMSFWAALGLAVFGGRESSSTQRRLSQQLRRNSMAAGVNTLSAPPKPTTGASTKANNLDSTKHTESLDVTDSAHGGSVAQAAENKKPETVRDASGEPNAERSLEKLRRLHERNDVACDEEDNNIAVPNQGKEDIDSDRCNDCSKFSPVQPCCINLASAK